MPRPHFANGTKSVQIDYCIIYRPPSSCSDVSTTRRMNSLGWVRLTTSPSSPVPAASALAQLRPEGRLNAARNSASHQVTILIAANEACRGKSNLPPLTRTQSGSRNTVCISCVVERNILYYCCYDDGNGRECRWGWLCELSAICIFDFECTRTRAALLRVKKVCK